MPFHIFLLPLLPSINWVKKLKNTPSFAGLEFRKLRRESTWILAEGFCENAWILTKFLCKNYKYLPPQQSKGSVLIIENKDKRVLFSKHDNNYGLLFCVCERNKQIPAADAFQLLSTSWVFLRP